MSENLMLDDEGRDLIPSLLQQLVYEPNISLRLQALDTLLNGIKKEISDKMKVRVFDDWLRKKYLNNTQFMRQLKLYSKINENVETAIEYHGQDYITHAEYVFNDEFENQVMELTKAINTFVGMLLKEYAKGESIEFG